MAFKVVSAMGLVVEGKLALKNGLPEIVEDEDGESVSLLEALSAWEGRKIRVVIADLELAETLAQLGLQPGQELQFVDSLTDSQKNDLLGDSE